MKWLFTLLAMCTQLSAGTFDEVAPSTPEEIATFGGYTFALGFHEAAGMSLIASGCATAMYHAQDMKAPDIAWKNTNP